mgnify:CR=1 FL=1
MIPTIQELGLDQLSVEHRLAIAEALWDSVANGGSAGLPTPAQRVEMEHRLADSIGRPEAVAPWETIKARALARARR